MKGMICTLLVGLSALASAEERTFKIPYAKDEDRERISSEMLKGFQALLEADKALAAEFEKLQEGAKERAGGRYSLGRPQFLVLPRSESVEFLGQTGTREFKDVVVIYFPFSEGERRGSATTEGTFAKFRISGSIDYRHVEDKDDFEVKTSNVMASFVGFSSSLQVTE